MTDIIYNMTHVQTYDQKDMYNELLGQLKDGFVRMSVALVACHGLMFLLGFLPKSWQEYELTVEINDKHYPIHIFYILYRVFEGLSFLISFYMLNIALQI